MATPTLYMSPISVIVQYLTNLGLMAAGGQVTIYQGGTVSTLLATFTDSTGIVQNSNPLTLNSTGRPASASGAPVAFWHASGVTATLSVTDALGNQLVSLPNIPAINDPGGASSLQSALANPAFGSGVDLVANGVKAYDVVATVQANVSPTLAAGQNLIIIIEGGAAIGDGLGGIFYWSASSTAVDDGGITTISPLGSPATGRYLRASFSQVGTFTGTLTGMAGATTGTVKYIRIGNRVTLWVDTTIAGTSNTTAMTMTGIPAALTPAQVRNVPCTQMYNSGVATWGECVVANNSVITFLGVTLTSSLVQSAAALFANTGTKGIQAGWTITYTL